MKANQETRPLSSLAGTGGLLVLAVLALAFREPGYFTSPRFWAEEGTVFFSYARVHGAWDTLCQPHLGYYSLYPNLASLVAARLAPLTRAPLATTLMALLAQTAPLLLLVFGRSRYWPGTGRKALALAAVLLAPLSYEGWLNTINSQFYLCLFTALLLLEPPPPSPWARGLLRAMLALSGLTGPPSCLLFPLYWLRAVREKEGELAVWAGLLGLCGCIQAGVMAFSHSASLDAGLIRAAGISLPGRAVWAPLPFLGLILTVKSLLLNFLGPAFSAPLAQNLHRLAVQGGWAYQTAGYGGLLSVSAFLFGLALGVPGPARYLLPLSFLLLAVPATVRALSESPAALISPYAAQRYYYVPNVLVWLLIICGAETAGAKFLTAPNLVRVALLALALFWGGREFGDFNTQARVFDPAWPHWSDEISLWRQDSSHRLKIWPVPWTLSLPPAEGGR